MPGGIGGGIAGGGGIALLSTALLSSVPPPPPPVLMQATKDDMLFTPWKSEDEGTWSGDEAPNPECAFYNGSVVYTSQICSHFAISRLASSATSLALERATKCATVFELDCVLSAEIGLSVPAAFLYSHELVGMQMLLAPSIISGGSEVKVRINQQSDARHFYRRFNETITVAYMPSGRRAPVTETFTGSAAWCVQLLRAAYSSECWAQLD